MSLMVLNVKLHVFLLNNLDKLWLWFVCVGGDNDSEIDTPKASRA